MPDKHVLLTQWQDIDYLHHISSASSTEAVSAYIHVQANACKLQAYSELPELPFDEAIVVRVDAGGDEAATPVHTRAELDEISFA